MIRGSVQTDLQRIEEVQFSLDVHLIEGRCHQMLIEMRSEGSDSSISSIADFAHGDQPIGLRCWFFSLLLCLSRLFIGMVLFDMRFEISAGGESNIAILAGSCFVVRL